MRFQKNVMTALALTFAFCVTAKENVNEPSGGIAPGKTSLATDCDAAQASFDLSVNNVRATIHTGGDMWWDLNTSAEYEVPNGGGVNSMFSGSTWIGGVDAGGQLKLAAMTYRQSGEDFWPGPLDDNASITQDECRRWDKFFTVTKDEVEAHLADYLDEGVQGPIPQSILEWPGRGNPNNPLVDPYTGREHALAPFATMDPNSDPELYNPADGDYPTLFGCPDARPDRILFWIYNDKGNIHTETGAEAIGIEVQAQAFAFKTNDEINDATFYSYRLINRSSTTLDSTYMAKWTDPDLGCAFNDYVGSDTTRDLGICYNGEAQDESTCSPGYTAGRIPMIGTDFFQGPLDTAGNELGMAHFLFYQNDFSQVGNPENASHYYGYLTGSWKDGTPFTCGGNGYGGSTRCDYMYPGEPTDPNGWSECTENNQPADRRMMQSSGPFILEPGAVNFITVGVVWVPKANYPCPSFQVLQIADDKAQALYDNCFELVAGPDAPDLTIRELDRELILSIWNDSLSNNNNETYRVADPIIRPDVEALIEMGYPGVGAADSFYIFQGYKLYQLKDQQSSITDLGNTDRIRLIAQVDVKDTIDMLINWEEDVDMEEMVPELMVDGNNDGIRHVFRVTDDAFATGASRGLVNHKTYYFTAVAYAYNRFRKFSPNDTLPGQMSEYAEGLSNVEKYAATPHQSHHQDGGTILNAQYGDNPTLTREEGSGSGGRVIDLTAASVEEIFNNGQHRVKRPEYVAGNAPADVMIFDPMVVPDANFKLSVMDPLPDTATVTKLPDTARWVLENLKTGQKVYAERPMNRSNEQLVFKWGFLIDLAQVPYPGQDDAGLGFLEATMDFEDPLEQWLSGVEDQDGTNFFSAHLNWIRSGTNYDDSDSPDPSLDDFGCPLNCMDPDGIYEGLLGGTWAPYRLCNDNPRTGAPMNWEMINPAVDHSQTATSLDSLVSVDVVFTPDQSKWSRCPVVEMQQQEALAVGGAKQFHLRKEGGLKKDGTLSHAPIDSGYSWFPGYAINVETGERLNIMFGEDSWRGSDNGADMIWNPSFRTISLQGDFKFGGKHIIYVMKSKYDKGQKLHGVLKEAESDPDTLYDAYNQAMWVNVPLRALGYEYQSVADGLIPDDNEARVRLRVAGPLNRYAVGDDNNNMPVYTFSTSEFAVEQGVTEVSQNALDSIRVVPNPYYAYSGYEQGQLDNRVKITNLPSNCTVQIFTMNGIIVREFPRDVISNTSEAASGMDNTIDWDLTNAKNIPVAGGIYLIRVEAPGLGERTVKFFCIKRPTDLDTF